MTFSLHQGGVVISSDNTHTQSSNIHPLAHILDTFSIIFMYCSNNNNNLNSPFHLGHRVIANCGPTHTSVRNSSGIAIETTKYILFYFCKQNFRSSKISHNYVQSSRMLGCNKPIPPEQSLHFYRIFDILLVVTLTFTGQVWQYRRIVFHSLNGVRQFSTNIKS